MHEVLKDREFKVGESDSGRTLRMKFHYFLEYLINQQDDSPLYLFESSFQKSPRAPELLRYYKVPKYFQKDYFPYVA
jgi:histone arginine demethylase JMJD6